MHQQHPICHSRLQECSTLPFAHTIRMLKKTNISQHAFHGKRAYMKIQESKTPKKLSKEKVAMEACSFNFLTSLPKLRTRSQSRDNCQREEYPAPQLLLFKIPLGPHEMANIGHVADHQTGCHRGTPTSLFTLTDNRTGPRVHIAHGYCHRGGRPSGQRWSFKSGVPNRSCN